MRRVVRSAGPPLAGTAAVVGVWWVATVAFSIRSFLLPSPLEVVGVFDRLGGYLLAQLWVTSTEAIVGFGLAIATGVPAGVLLAFSRVVASAVWPVLVALHAIPKLALAPMLVVWLGFGFAPKVLMVVLVCGFPVVLSTAIGVARTPGELVELARSLSASRWQTFTRIRIPYAWPQIFTGLKQAAPLAVIGVVVGELFGALAGLGYAIRNAGADTPVVFAALVLLAGLSIGLFYLVVAAERVLVPWVRHTTS